MALATTPRHIAPAAPNATLVRQETVGSTIVRLHVRPDDGVPSFRPGQYVALGLQVGERGLVQRPYSIASPADEPDALEFLVRLVVDGALTPRLWDLRPGARLRMGPPKGLFTGDVADPRRPLLIGTGTGIAPLLSILETHVRRVPADRVSARPLVVHGAAFAADLAGQSRLGALEATGRIIYVPAVSRTSEAANAGWRGATGRLDGLLPAILAIHGVDPGSTVAYICGNPGLVDTAVQVLGGLGFPTDAVRTEAWSAGPPAA